MITIFRERRRWLITFLLFFISTVAYLDRQTLSILSKTVKAALAFSDSEYSYLVAGFLIALGLGYSFAGRLIDRFGVKVSFAVALTVWSTATILHSLAAGWISLLFLRVVLGLGESFYTPVAAKVLATWIPLRERGICWGVFSIGNFVGAMAAPPLIAWLTLCFNWRFSFAATGSAGFVLLGVWLWYYDSPEEHTKLSDAERTLILRERGASPVVAEQVSTWRLLARPAICGFLFTRFVSDSVTFFFVFWLSDYLQAARGFTLEMIGLMGWIPYLGADIGALGGGAISDWIIRKGVNPRQARRRILLGAACLMPSLLLVTQLESQPCVVGLLALIMLLQASWNTNLTTLIIESSPQPQVGQVVSLTLLGGTLGGSLSMLLTGYVVRTVGYDPMIFVAVGFAHLTAYAILSGGLWVEDRRHAG